MKAILTYCFTPTRMAAVNKTDHSKYWWGSEETEMCICWYKCKMVMPLWETVQQFLKMLNTELPDDLAIPLLGLYLRNKCIYPHKNLYVNVHSSIIHMAQNVETTQKSINWWTKKMWSIQTAIKRNQVLIHATICMNFENMLRESQTQMVTYFMIPFMWSVQKR